MKEAIKQEVDFVFNLLIIADFAQAFLNRFAGVAVATTFNVNFTTSQGSYEPLQHHVCD